jgi:hypothetical protein
VRHKHIRIDQAKLDKAKKVLAATTETEALDRASASSSRKPTSTLCSGARPPKGSSRSSSGDMRRVVIEAGDVLRRLQARRGFHFKTSHSIVNDVLIALSARSIGATVVTQNEGHYRAIQAVRPFQLTVVD